MTNLICVSTGLELCRDESTAFMLKFVAIGLILIAGIGGIAIPLVKKHRRFLYTDGSIFVGAKAFAVGGILATGFVHMISDSTKALNNPCLESYTWSKFPFTGFFAMMLALFTLLVDFVATQYYERKHRESGVSGEYGQVVDVNVDVDDVESLESDSGIVSVVEVNEWVVRNGKVFGEEESSGMHIVGMHAHAAHYRHSHPYGHHACHGGGGSVKEHHHGHSHDHGHFDLFLK